VSFFESETGHLQGAQLTHQNMTAGTAAIRALLPPSHALSSLDTIVSAHSLGTAFGRAVAYSAIFEGTSFGTLESSKLFYVEEHPLTHDIADILSSKNFPIPSPTIFFIKPGHLESLVTSISKHAKKSWLLYPFARRHKLANLAEGYITKESLWDRLVFDGARAKVIGDGAGTLRAVVVGGGAVSAPSLTPSRISLSIPLVNAFIHPLVPGPVLASHPLDLQDFPSLDENAPSSVAHVGPPSVNTEVKLVGVDDNVIESGGDPVGLLLIRGPSVGKHLNNDDFVSIPSDDDKEGWIATGVRAKVQTNGAFKVLAAK